VTFVGSKVTRRRNPWTAKIALHFTKNKAAPPIAMSFVVLKVSRRRNRGQPKRPFGSDTVLFFPYIIP
jgi:hypothetical protein